MGYEVRHSKLKLHHHLNHHDHKPRLSGPNVNNMRDPDSQQLGPPPLGYPPLAQPAGPASVPYYSPNPLMVQQQELQLQQALADAKRHGRNERIGEVGAVAAGAFALYELHEAKVDPAHARRHKLEAKLAGAVAVGSANYAYHEHQEKKKSEHLVQVLSGGTANAAVGRPLIDSDKSKLKKKKKQKEEAALTQKPHADEYSNRPIGKQSLFKLMSGDPSCHHPKCKHPHRTRLF